MSDQIHELERREIMIHTAAIRAAIYAARGLPYDLGHAMPIPPLTWRALIDMCPPPVIDCRPAERLGLLIGESDDTEGGAHD